MLPYPISPPVIIIITIIILGLHATLPHITPYPTPYHPLPYPTPYHPLPYPIYH